MHAQKNMEGKSRLHNSQYAKLGQSPGILISNIHNKPPQNTETYHAAILGKRGVRISCVKANQAMAMMLPATPPYRTWLQVW